MSISTLCMISMTASAILADIQAYYVGVDVSLIQMVLTLPALLGLIFAFAAGPLSMRIPKKNIVVFGLICGLMGGMVGLFLGSISIWVLLFGSVLVGVAQGINSTMTMALIADFFTGEESGAMMGLQSAFVNGGGMVIMFTSGLLAGIQWNYSYFVYLVFIPVLVIVIKNLPNEQPTASVDKKSGEVLEKSWKLNGMVYFTALIMFLFGVFIFAFQANIASLVASKGFGDASVSGFINTTMLAAGMVTGILFGRITRVLKSFTIPAALIVTVIGMVLIFAVGTLPSLFIAAACMGFGLATIMPAGTFIAANAVTPGMFATAIAIVTAAVNLGMFISPIVLNALSNSLSGGSITFKFMISAVGLALVAVLSIAGNFVIAKRQTQI
ncbi:MAG: MFS transporter [Eubacteriaceae bacterium]|nr:MFS transporter [Eubacteriaceae bacterium]